MPGHYYYHCFIIVYISPFINHFGAGIDFRRHNGPRHITHRYSNEVEGAKQAIFYYFELKKTLWSPWFIKKHSAVGLYSFSDLFIILYFTMFPTDIYDDFNLKNLLRSLGLNLKYVSALRVKPVYVAGPGPGGQGCRELASNNSTFDQRIHE